MDYGDFLERWMSWMILKSVTTVYYPSIENYGFAPSIDRKPGHLGLVLHVESTLRLPAARSLTEFANCENSLLSMVTGARAGAIFRPRRPPRVTLYGRGGRNIARGPRPRVWAGDGRGAVHRQPRTPAALGHPERPVSNSGGAPSPCVLKA